MVFGKELPIAELKEISTKSELPLSYLKYDALIVASALRYGVNVLVSLDEGMHKLAARCGLRCATPSEFENKPRQLRLVPRDDEQEGSGTG